MSRRLDHLASDDLRRLAALALAQLPPRQRDALLARFPAPPPADRPAPPEVAAVHAAAERLRDALHDADADLARLWGEPANPTDPVEATLREASDALHAAVDTLLAWLQRQPGSTDLRASVDDAVEAGEALWGWRSERTPQLRFVDLLPRPRAWDTLLVWQLVADPSVDVEALVGRLVDVPPLGPPLLVAATGRRARAVLTELERRAGLGEPGAARWLVHEATGEGKARLLDAYAALAPDLGAAWADLLAADGHWDALVAGAERSPGAVAVPPPLLYRALLATCRPEEAWHVGLGAGDAVPVAQIWDDAQALGRLDGLRAAAARSARPEARWLARPEAELLRLPSRRYDHEAAKEVVRYAVARLSRGERPSTVRAALPSDALLARLAVAEDPHDPAACLHAALDALERLVAFHVAGRTRSRYTRAVTYWREHERLRIEHADLLRTSPHRAASLEERFGEELRRLPGLADALASAG